jgi:YfiH family protein
VGWDQAPNGVALFRFPRLATEPGCLHAVAGRAGGLSRPPYGGLNLALHVGDAPATVVANRERLAAALGADLDRFAFADQVHGHQVTAVSAEQAGAGARAHADALPATDALITAVPGLVLAVLVADCVPLLLYDPVARAAGAVHAGWRGTVQDIAGHAVRAMGRAFGSRPGDLLAAIGPAVGAEDYEVDGPVIQAVRAAFPAGWPRLLRPTRDGHALLDLPRANTLQLLAAGLRDAAIERSAESTVRATDRLYSVRGEGRATGRFAAVIALR